jgi:hypothetical protein
MGVRVSFLEDTGARGSAPAPALKGVLVPASAIVERGGKSVVFAIDGDRVHEQAVSAGPSFGDLRLIEGIAAGTRVVRTPPADMHDHARVRLQKP